jgi:cell division protein FtsB
LKKCEIQIKIDLVSVKNTHFNERKRVWHMKKKFNIKSVVKIFALVYVCYILVNQQVTMNRQKKQLQIYNVELQKKNQENKVLQDEAKLSKTEKYIEKQAREKLGLVKKGETPVLDKKN